MMIFIFYVVGARYPSSSIGGVTKKSWGPNEGKKKKKNPI
jgi:hypothetical protein